MCLYWWKIGNVKVVSSVCCWCCIEKRFCCCFVLVWGQNLFSPSPFLPMDEHQNKKKTGLVGVEKNRFIWINRGILNWERAGNVPHEGILNWEKALDTIVLMLWLINSVPVVLVMICSLHRSLATLIAVKRMWKNFLKAQSKSPILSWSFTWPIYC